jgi:hypothetical protein
MAKLNISEKARRAGISPNVVHNRMHTGWTLKRALETPVRHKRKSRTIKAIKIEKVDFPFTAPNPVEFPAPKSNDIWLSIIAATLIGLCIVAFIL